MKLPIKFNFNFGQVVSTRNISRFRVCTRVTSQTLENYNTKSYQFSKLTFKHMLIA